MATRKNEGVKMKMTLTMRLSIRSLRIFEEAKSPRKRVVKKVLAQSSQTAGAFKEDDEGAWTQEVPSSQATGASGIEDGGTISDVVPDQAPDDDDDFEDYVDAVTSHVAGYSHFIPLYSLFRDGILTRGRPRMRGIICDSKPPMRYFQDYEVESIILEKNAEGTEDRDVAATLFSRRILGRHRLESLYSVQSMSSSELKGRAIARERYPDVPEDEIEDLEDFVDSSLDSLSIGELARGPGTTVSYLPIHPPFWARIPSDPKLYSDPPPARTPPDGPSSSSRFLCNCGTTRTFFNRDGLKKTKRCKLYTLLTVHDVEIEVQVCPLLYLLRDALYRLVYAIVKTLSPFWKEFMGDDLFRAVWFAYVSLQKFDNDMSSFGRKHLSGSLRPPTFTMPDSVRRPNVKYKPKQQLLPLATLRRRFRATMERPTHPDRIEDGEEEGGVDGAKSPSKKSASQPKAKKVVLRQTPGHPSKRGTGIPRHPPLRYLP
ncbi:hypothetical protein D9611_015075 [Ephemerocybe angulata]|uniref:Uncharacterized protein n=1 Tax=Ephemerocybe angulata TaxID=980116 RepID=A0A8H5F8U3_9AGAR|nr:hypothetical protein D9611_015075 [Tulosesus angulatus]